MESPSFKNDSLAKAQEMAHLKSRAHEMKPGEKHRMNGESPEMRVVWKSKKSIFKKYQMQ